MNNIFAKLRNLDAYPKINEDFYNRTLSGGLITLVSSILMILLFISELRLYINSMTHTELVVDTSRGETLRINFDVTFPALPCSILSLDAMDISGEQHLDVKHDVIKNRIDANGKIIETKKDGVGVHKMEKPLQNHGGRLEHNETYCGSCYGAQATDKDCCNSCEEVREAYRKKGWGMSNPDEIDQCKREGFLQNIKDEHGEGCNIYGFLEVNKVAGNFHFAPGKSFQHENVHVHDVTSFQMDSFNISHKINKLSFGESFPGVVNPLDQVQWTQKTPTGMFQYFVKKGNLNVAVSSIGCPYGLHRHKQSHYPIKSVLCNRAFQTCNSWSTSFSTWCILLLRLISNQGYFHRATCVLLTFPNKYLCHSWRYVHSFWYIRFIHISWSEGDKKENGDRKI